ncbi:MAG: glycosyltransferase family A protein [Methylococcaceae bacterium]|nr:glycosyltransferase family A protein [Methylococcaceae bacterium]
MKVSLVLATLGRDNELLLFLDSLQYQTYYDFELIVIDQNQDGKIDSILARYADHFCINHVKVDFTGNARARNYGIQFARGEIIAFPDDDCAYELDVLKQVVEEFKHREETAILAVGSYDFSKTRFSIGVNDRKAQYFSRFRMMGVEFTHFFNLNKVDHGEFYMDHDFGIGSKYSGAEGFELLYRLLRAGHVAYYDPMIRIYHADKDNYKVGGKRMLMYSSGVGAYIRKFAKEYDIYILYYIIRKMFIAPTIKMILAVFSLNPRRVEYSFNNLVGIWRGFLAYGR